MSRILYTPREFPRQRKKPVSKGKKYFFLIFFIIFFVIGGGVWLLRFPALQISLIRFSGLRVLREAQVRQVVSDFLSGAYAAVIPRSAFLFVDTEAISDVLLNTFPRIQSIEIQKEFPDTLVLAVRERTFWGIFCGRGNLCAYIDEEGVAYEEAPYAVGSIIRKVKSDGESVVPGERAVSPELMERLIVLDTRAESVLGSAIIEYRLPEQAPGEIHVTTADGFQIYFNREDDFENVFRVLKTALEEEIGDRRYEIEYIDARFGNKVFYK